MTSSPAPSCHTPRESEASQAAPLPSPPAPSHAMSPPKTVARGRRPPRLLSEHRESRHAACCFFHGRLNLLQKKPPPPRSHLSAQREWALGPPLLPQVTLSHLQKKPPQLGSLGGVVQRGAAGAPGEAPPHTHTHPWLQALLYILNILTTSEGRTLNDALSFLPSLCHRRRKISLMFLFLK